MARPPRLKTKNGKVYYVDKKTQKRVYIKVPAGISQKQLQKITININTEGKRLKKKKKPAKNVYGKKVLKKGMTKVINAGLPQFVFDQPKIIANPNPPLPTGQKLDETKPNPPKEELKDIYEKLFNNSKYVEELKKHHKKTYKSPSEKGESKEEEPKGESKEEEPEKQEEEPAPAPKKKSKKHIDTDQLSYVVGVVAERNPKSFTAGGKEFAKLVNSYREKYYGNTDYSKFTNKKLDDAIKIYNSRKDEIKRGIEEFKKKAKEEGKPDISSYLFSAPAAAQTQGEGINDGLYNDEIEKIAKHAIKGNYIPVIAQDEIPSLLRYVKKGKKAFGAIINTNPSSSDGSGKDGYRTGHWTSVFVDGRDDYPSVEYFDPLVQDDPSKQLKSTLEQIAHEISPDVMAKFKYNRIQRQSHKSNDCGIHAIKFIEDRFQGVPWSTATGYDHWKKRQEGGGSIKQIGDDSKNGEAIINKFKNIYKKWL